MFTQLFRLDLEPVILRQRLAIEVMQLFVGYLTDGPSCLDMNIAWGRGGEDR
jgi:hypothetical protein